MTLSANFTGLVPVALAASAVVGLLGASCLGLGLRAFQVVRNAGARFVLWFAMLLALTAVAPAFLASGTVWLERIPTVSIPSSALGTGSVDGAPTNLPGPARAIPVRPQTAAPRFRTPRTGFDLATVLGALWLAGLTVSLVRIAFGLTGLRRIVRAAELVEIRETPRGLVKILVSDRFAVPVAWGYRHPAIIMPRCLLTLEHDTDFENVLLHELEHLRRFDDVTSLVQAACMCVLWFNPFAYYVAERIAVEREMACDEGVIARTGKPAKYAATLWKVALSAADAPTPAIISAFTSGSHTVSRLNNLLSECARSQKTPRPFVAAFAGLLPVVLLASAAVAPAMVFKPAPITDFTSIRLHDGDSLVIGGRRADGYAVTGAQLYDARGHRIAIINAPLSLWSAAASRLQDGNVLVTGGVTPSGVTADAELYHVRTHRFERLAPMNVPLANHSAMLLRNGEVLIAANERSERQRTAPEIFDPNHRRFERGADDFAPVAPAAVVFEKGYVLVLGQVDRHGKRCMMIYDPEQRIYREAGTILHAGARSFTFKSPDGQIVTHYVQSV